ncbi:hypothetical protein [Actinoplanes sp. NBRC 101535]|uniref:hypothetical protein n=1 Tax=Actinoplanes sp. NBRC 101535 TaxID=3032196 RepID=UPI0024A22EBC|nr:hypothetical protein [Actinoplanes sp. NBRC 101535]GLY00257.1 ABC transporter permease [Actinoplanes sp. NBRC 101535]
MIRAEWIRFRSLPSFAVSLAAMVALSAGCAALFSLAQGRQWEPGDPFDPVRISLSGILITQIVAGTAGILAITTETATGSLRSTLAATPRRGRVLAAKALVVAVPTAVLGVLGGFLGFLAGQPVLAGQGAPSARLGDPGVARSVLGVGVFLAAASLIGLALGALFRSTAGALALFTAVMLLVPMFMTTLPVALARWVMKWWPPLAGIQGMSTVPDDRLLGPGPGLLVLTGYAVAALTVAVIVMRRRDVA